MRLQIWKPAESIQNKRRLHSCVSAQPKRVGLEFVVMSRRICSLLVDKSWVMPKVNYMPYVIVDIKQKWNQHVQRSSGKFTVLSPKGVDFIITTLALPWTAATASLVNSRQLISDANFQNKSQRLLKLQLRQITTDGSLGKMCGGYNIKAKWHGIKKTDENLSVGTYEFLLEFTMIDSWSAILHWREIIVSFLCACSVYCFACVVIRPVKSYVL